MVMSRRTPVSASTCPTYLSPLRVTAMSWVWHGFWRGRCRMSPVGTTIAEWLTLPC